MFFLQQLYAVIHTLLCSSVEFIHAPGTMVCHSRYSAGRLLDGLNTPPYLFYTPPPFHFKHPVYFFQEMDLVDWIIFAVGRLTVRLETKWTPKSISNGEQQQVSSCIAGIGFVIEKWNGAGGWVGGGVPFLLQMIALYFCLLWLLLT